MAKRCGSGDDGRGVPASRSPLYYRVHSLLHTVRSIGQHEDQLCGLLHDLEHGAGSEPVESELRTMLEQMPLTSYQQEMRAVWQTIGSPKPGRMPVKTARTTKNRKKAAQAGRAATGRSKAAKPRTAKTASRGKAPAKAPARASRARKA